jgi:phosphoribosyl 1,2-cyclic phosphodiesterase
MADFEDSGSIEILFLGTGAADWPAPYRPGPGEAEAGAVRGLASVLVDSRALIDFGATVPDAIRHFGVDPNRITDILLTHGHADHCSSEALGRLISQRDTADTVDLWAHPTALARFADIDGVCRHAIDVGQTIELHSVAVTALAANHLVEGETPLHFLLQKSGTSVLYATDGAWFTRPTWTLLRELNLDAIIWDATCGETQGDWRIFEHNSVDMIEIMLQTLVKEGVLSPASRVYLTHMSKGLCAPHEDMTRRLTHRGLIPAHDGLAIYVSNLSA